MYTATWSRGGCGIDCSLCTAYFRVRCGPGNADCFQKTAVGRQASGLFEEA